MPEHVGYNTSLGQKTVDKAWRVAVLVLDMFLFRKKLPESGGELRMTRIEKVVETKFFLMASYGSRMELFLLARVVNSLKTPGSWQCF